MVINYYFLSKVIEFFLADEVRGEKNGNINIKIKSLSLWSTENIQKPYKRWHERQYEHITNRGGTHYITAILSTKT